jgi:hypothetical protein
MLIEARSTHHVHPRGGLAPGRARALAGLLAVYAPLVSALVLLRGPVAAKVFVVAGVWAFETIVWYVLEGQLARRRPRKLGS